MTNKHNLITEVKEAIKKASIDYPWDTNGTFIEWENGHPLKGTHRTIAYTDASWSGGVQFENPNHAADAHLICNAPTWLQKLVTELEEERRKNQLLKNYLLELADSTNSEIIQAQIGNVLKEVFE